MTEVKQVKSTMTEVKLCMTEVKQEKSTMTEVKLCMTEVKLSCRSYDRSETKGYMAELKLIQNYGLK